MVGINLSTADTIVIYDCDWNPHMDMQALSRAHRLGQKKTVMVYKMVTKHSVEERIIQVAKQKMLLDQAFVENIEGDLSGEDLQSIVTFGSKNVFEADDTKDFAMSDEQVAEMLDRDKAVSLATAEAVSTGSSTRNEFFAAFKVWKEDPSLPPLTTEQIAATVNGDVEFWESLVQQKLSNAKNPTPAILLGERRSREKTPQTPQALVRSRESLGNLPLQPILANGTVMVEPSRTVATPTVVPAANKGSGPVRSPSFPSPLLHYIAVVKKNREREIKADMTLFYLFSSLHGLGQSGAPPEP